MIEAAEEAKRDAATGKGEFARGGQMQKAVLLDLIHFTESADGASSSLKKLNPRIPWKRLARLRNEGLVHDYPQVNLDDIWAFVTTELSGIRRQLDKIKYPKDEDD
jgi:uncharacterized protein with HEPN domain